MTSFSACAGREGGEDHRSAPRGGRARCASALLASVVAAVGVLALPRGASAQTGRTTQGFFLRNATAIRYNPLGLYNDTRLGQRWRLFASDESLFRTTFVAVGASVMLSPAFARAGVGFELQPLSILHLSVTYEAGGYFGTFGLLQSFPTANTCAATNCDPTRSPVFSDAEINRRGALPPSDPQRNYATAFHQVTVGGVLQFRVGDLIVRSNNRFVYQDARLRGDDRVFYDQFWDILFPNHGWIYVNDVDLVYEPIPSLRVGVRYNITHAFYTSEHFAQSDLSASGEPPATRNDTVQRIGPVAAYTFFERRHGVFNAPTLAVVFNWYLQHPYRAGGDVSGAITRALPYMALQFSFRLDP